MASLVASWLGTLWIAMAVHLWQTAIFVAALAVVALTLRGTSARALNLLYWTGILKLLLPLPLLGPLTRAFLAASSAGAPAATDAGWAVTVLMVPAALSPGTSGAPSVPPLVWLGWTAAWIGGVTLLVLRGLARSRPPDFHAPGEPALAAIADAGLRPDQVRISPDVPGPCVRGWLRPVVVLPDIVARRLDADELRATLLHEREHLVRRDPLRYALLAAFRAAFWFYPPVWWLARRIHETTELVCDEAVARAGLPAATYCRSLARTLKLGLDHGGATSPVGVLGHRVSFLHRRLERIRSGRRFEAMLHHRLTVVAAALIAVAVSLLPVAPVPSLHAQDPALAAGTGLEGLEAAELPVTLNFEGIRLDRLFEALTRATGVDFRLFDDLAARTATVDVGKTSLKLALQQIAMLTGVRYRLVDDHTVEVRAVLLAGMDGVTQPLRIEDSYVKPEYPAEAREGRVEGRVILQAVIDHRGNVGNVELLSVTPPGHEGFTRSATAAVSRWRYEPATRGGEPVDVYFTIQVEFALK